MKIVSFHRDFLMMSSLSALLILSTIEQFNSMGPDVSTATVKELSDTPIVPYAQPVHVAALIAVAATPMNWNFTTKPLPAAIPAIPVPSPTQTTCQPSTSVNGYELLHIAEDDIFYDITAYPLSESMAQDITCFFMNGNVLNSILFAFTLYSLDFRILSQNMNIKYKQ